MDDPSVDLESLWLTANPHYLRDIGVGGIPPETLSTVLYLKLIREKFPDLRLKQAALRR